MTLVRRVTGDSLGNDLVGVFEVLETADDEDEDEDDEEDEDDVVADGVDEELEP